MGRPIDERDEDVTTAPIITDSPDERRKPTPTSD
jgi:hypothetical protein